MTTTRVHPGGDYGALFSAAVASDDLVLVGGTTAWDGCRDGDVESQARFVFKKIDGFLEACGATRSDVLFVQVYLADIDTWEDMNRAWLDWVDPEAVPARVSVETRLLEGLKVEVTCIARRQSRPDPDPDPDQSSTSLGK